MTRYQPDRRFPFRTAIIAVLSHAKQEVHEGSARVLGPSSRRILGSFLIDHHQLGPVVAAEGVSGGVANPTFGADLVGIEPEGRAGRAGSPEEPVRHQIICIFGAEARIEGIAAPARRADHALRKRALRASIGQFGAISDAEPILRRELPKAHRAALHWGGLGLASLGSLRRSLLRSEGRAAGT